jgi:glycine cleavage system aminomethyltransferase T
MSDLDLTLDELRLHMITRGAVVAPARCAVFEVRGPGSLDCLQGLVTSDLVKPGPGSMIYGALLTPKGMLVVDLWVLRRHDALTIITPLQGREAALETFQRSLPPRLAQLTDRTGEIGITLVIGEQASEVLHALPLHLPEAAGRLVEHQADNLALTVARPPRRARFSRKPGHSLE